MTSSEHALSELKNVGERNQFQSFLDVSYFLSSPPTSESQIARNKNLGRGHALHHSGLTG